MAQEYKVVKVSSQEPKEWQGPKGTIFYIKVMVEGHDKAIEVGKKSKDAIKVGDTLYGTITESQYDTDRFKAEKNPNSSFGGRQTRDDAVIQAQFAIKAAIEYHKEGTKLSDIEATAKELFAMIARVKGSVSEKPSLKEQWNKTIEKKVAQTSTDTPPVEAYKDVVVEPTDDELEKGIDISDIPF